MDDSFLTPVEKVLEDIRAGKIVVLADDSSRENEGDVMVAAEKVTPEAVNFMMQHARGLICLSMPAEQYRHLGIPLQETESAAVFGTNFCVMFDHRDVAHSGITASSRAYTMKAAARADAKPEEFIAPGFVVPVAAVPGGVLKRRGQTEGSVDIARLAGLFPAGVICEVMDERGEMVRGDKLVQFCRSHNLSLTTVEAIKQYRIAHEICIRRVESAKLTDPLEGVFGPGGPSYTFEVFVYVDDVDDKEHFALVFGKPQDGALVRIHSECLTGDVFGSKRCDCGFQFQTSLRSIIAEGSGVLVYLHQEGRGIGLGNKIRAYELQEQGLDTVEANVQLGFRPDGRDYRVGAHILQDLGLHDVRLMTNNPEKLESLERFGVKVRERVSLMAREDSDNAAYLRTKRDRMGHLFERHK